MGGIFGGAPSKPKSPPPPTASKAPAATQSSAPSIETSDPNIDKRTDIDAIRRSPRRTSSSLFFDDDDSNSILGG